MMANSPAPDLSVVIFTPDTYETIRKTIGHLRAQTARDRLEILIAAPSRETLQLDEAEMEPFVRWSVVEVGPVEQISEGKIPAIHQASAPVIAFAEDHSYPEPEWAAELIQAH